MLVTLPAPDPGPEADTENPAHKEPGGLWKDPTAIRLRAAMLTSNVMASAPTPGGGCPASRI
jgi:hypothetical protein